MLRLVPYLAVLLSGCLSVDGIPTHEATLDAGASSLEAGNAEPDSGSRQDEASEAGSDLGSQQDAASLDVGENPFACIDGARDPLIGLWQGPAGFATCEFFSNGRYREDCGLAIDLPGDWKRLDDGRYYFSMLNSFGALIDECIAEPTFGDACSTVLLDIACREDYPPPKVIELVRIAAP